MINLKEFDMHGLSTLWLASGRNPELRQLIEDELKLHIRNNTNFSREYIFQVSRILNRALGIFFIPSSEAHTMYGDYVTIDMILSDEEIVEMMTNYTSQPAINTGGQVRATITDLDISDAQKGLMETTGFHTRDILRTQSI